jgi:hypothetical protein
LKVHRRDERSRRKNDPKRDQHEEAWSPEKFVTKNGYGNGRGSMAVDTMLEYKEESFIE